jgi:hypothetical protein
MKCEKITIYPRAGGQLIQFSYVRVLFMQATPDAKFKSKVRMNSKLERVMHCDMGCYNTVIPGNYMQMR